MKGFLEWLFWSPIFDDLRVEHYKMGYEQGRFDEWADRELQHFTNTEDEINKLLGLKKEDAQ